ncbi:MAG TPA: PhoPQ-activated pathogenicity-like protein PqaA type [Candidatus Marinimicrobia bacterium]|nr:PhoPQ-activated pathogenicity-like protein PqaA type [Candidatus Neomarinimicrobiota bacterium]
MGGGSTRDKEPQAANELLVQAAVETKSIIAEISNIPFQPLNYVGDEKDDRTEDDIIAYGWRQYLEGGAKDEDVEWLARLPMTRAVVRAMDVIQELGADIDRPVEGFVIAGASKRGWTTWTTAIVDDRVIAIVPVVIDMLNVVPSFNHHWRCYGDWSPAINDYINEGIMAWTGSKEYARLMELVEPYSFIDQLTLPKFLINATGDEFFVTDSWQFYWNDLVGDKYIQYVPNANHGLNGTYNLGSLVAFYNAVITDSAIPKFDWSVNADSIYLEVFSDVDYKVTKWAAVNENARDFRVPVIGKVWKSVEIPQTADNRYAVHFSAPENGYKAGLLEIVFESGAEVPFTFTTGTVVTPDAYPFSPFTPKESKGTPIK